MEKKFEKELNHFTPESNTTVLVNYMQYKIKIQKYLTTKLLFWRNDHGILPTGIRKANWNLKLSIKKLI